ncbi:MAG: phosphoglucosamine mutase [Candidatus Omnitrophota bacterium]
MNISAKNRLFGTDGIRGTPGEYPLTDGMIFKIGIGIARNLYRRGSRNKRLSAVIGKDTRASGGRLEALLTNAVVSQGVDVIPVGSITTPGLSYLTNTLNADVGIMISASHNKAEDNGVKLFDGSGCKLSEREEARIEELIFSTFIRAPEASSKRAAGKIRRRINARSGYTAFLQSSIEGSNLRGFTVAIDCACGATSPFAKNVFRKLGARVYCINNRPKGDNINTVGALDPDGLKKFVLEKKADIGIALDGDGDRGIIIDEMGNVIDGDHILAITACYLLNKDKLPKKTIVATVMSNLGLRKAISEIGGEIIFTKVGDKHVLEELLKNGLVLGGEQSGHIIFYDLLPTPDGMLTGLQILKIMKDTSTPLSKLAECMEKFPQILVNIKVREKRPFESMPEVSKNLKRFNDHLKNDGRILLRYSGTESLARVMVEGKCRDTITKMANSLAEDINNEIGIS